MVDGGYYVLANGNRFHWWETKEIKAAREREAVRKKEEEWDRHSDDRIAKRSAKIERETAEFRIDDQVFVRPWVIARDLKIHSARLKDWIMRGTPSGRMLRSLQTVAHPRRLYIHHDDRDWIVNNFQEARRRPRKPKSAPNP